MEETEQLPDYAITAIWAGCYIPRSFKLGFLSTVGANAVRSGLHEADRCVDSDIMLRDNLLHDERVIRAGYALGIIQAVYDAEGNTEAFA